MRKLELITDYTIYEGQRFDMLSEECLEVVIPSDIGWHYEYKYELRNINPRFGAVITDTSKWVVPKEKEWSEFNDDYFIVEKHRECAVRYVGAHQNVFTGRGKELLWLNEERARTIEMRVKWDDLIDISVGLSGNGKRIYLFNDACILK